MRKAQLIRSSIAIGAAIALCVVMQLIWAGNRAERNMLTCAGLKVEVDGERGFVTAEDVKGYLDAGYGVYIGQRIDSVDLRKVEACLDDKSAVLKSEAWTTPDGYLHVRITQREPVVRLQTAAGGFYADDRGYLFPLQGDYTCLVPIIDGELPLHIEPGFKGEPTRADDKAWLADLTEMVRVMSASKAWSGNIAQITVEANGDLVMIPREGRERFIFGQPTDAEEKFSKMSQYCTDILPAVGKDYYSTVNVKFADQIVCRQD